MKSLIAESKLLRQRHNEIVLKYQKLNEELERLKQKEKSKGGTRGLGRT